MPDIPQVVVMAAFWSPVSILKTTIRVATHKSVRGSLRILSLTPWSANDLERNVDSAIPGKLLGGDTF